MSDPLAAMRANMRSFYRLIGDAARQGAVIERDGVLAAVVPTCPDRSYVNAVIYEEVGALAAARPELERAFRDAGVRAWTVWVPEGDLAAARLLEDSGHRLDASPRAMTLDLARAPHEGAAGIAWSRTEDVGALAALNEEGYGLPAGEFDGAVTGLANESVHMYLARLDGKPAACAAALDDDGDCGIYFVATARWARRQGLAAGLVRQALVEARARGATTSSLQATESGLPIYRRLGYRDLGAIEMWEHGARGSPLPGRDGEPSAPDANGVG